MLAWTLLLACKDPPPADTGAAPSPSPYIYEEAEPPSPSLAGDAVGAAVQAAVDVLPQLTAQPIVVGYEAATVGQDLSCPDYYSDGTNTYWYDYCWTEDGSYFTGYGFIYNYVDYAAGDGYLYNGDAIFVVADVTNAAGYTFTGSGSAYMLDMVHPGDSAGNVPHTLYYSIIQGTFAYDGPEVAGSWMTTDLAPDLTMLAYNVPQETSPYYYGRYFTVSGGVNNLEGDVGTVVFDEVLLFEDTMYSDCPIEPAGTVSVRDGAGEWYDVLFDGPTEAAVEIEDDLCDGCGAVYFRGTYVGEACADFTALLDWQERPW